MQIITTDEDGMIVILYDSRWQYPELLGYMPGTIQHKCLYDLWLKVTEAQEEDSQNEEENKNVTRR